MRHAAHRGNVHFTQRLKSLPQNPFKVIPDLVFCQKSEDLGTEVHASMMIFLSVDVTNDRRHGGIADAERSVVCLPTKFRTLLTDPSRGIRFDESNSLGQSKIRGNLNEEVEVIGRTADGLAENFFLAADAVNVVPEVWPQRRSDERSAVFGREDYMDRVLNIGVGHNQINKSPNI